MMNIDAVSSRASSEMDINMPIPISSEDDDTEEKIIKEAENKISRSSAGSPFDGLLFFFQPKVCKRDFGDPLYMHSMRNDRKFSEEITKRG
jgi:hypothetical protein